MVRRRSDGALLLIRTRATQFELPKGHLEDGETHAQAARRELAEETAHRTPPEAGPLLAELSYRFDGKPPVQKRVLFYLFEIDDERIDFGPLPAGVRERRWLREEELGDLPLRSENLRALLAGAFGA